MMNSGIKIFIIGIALMAFLPSCKNSTVEDNSHYIVATTGMIGDALQNIVGEDIHVESLMGPGVDPHLFKATQGDLQKLTSAKAIFYNGLHLEGKMGEVFEKLGRTKPVIAVAEDIDPNKIRTVSEYNTHDPHIWFDVALWREAVEKMHQELIVLFPEKKEILDKNTEIYLEKLSLLHEEVKTLIATIPKEKRVLITAHDAFGYFGDAYDIEVKGLQGISTMSEFGLRDRVDLVNFIVDRQIKAVFVETSVSQRSINAVVEGCRDRGFEVKIGGSLFSDAMGDANTPEGTYIGMVKSNVHTIVTALK